MNKTHWKIAFDPNFLGGWDLEPGKDKILTIDRVKKEECTFEGGRKETHNVAHFVEKEKPMVLNATNSKMLAKLMDTPYIDDWKGKIQIYFDPTVKGKSGETTGGLRIRPKLPEDVKIACEECGQMIAPAFTETIRIIRNMTDPQTGYKRKEPASAATLDRAQIK